MNNGRFIQRTLQSTAITVLALVSLPHQAAAQLPIPDTVSPEARAVLGRDRPKTPQPPLPAPDDLAAWAAHRPAPYYFPAPAGQLFAALRKAALERYQPQLAETVMGGIPVLDLKPRAWKENGKVLVYVHGGAYVYGGLTSAPSSAAAVADITGLRVVCVGYTLAPEAKWDQVTDQVIAVIQALVSEGYALKDMAVYGDSAGGGLTAGAVLKMRDKGLGMPAAVVLWSPWSDITDSGDTYITLREADPFLKYGNLKNAADAYAKPEDQKNPYVSPVYGDYTKGFPPALIQGGTREILLSCFVRQYQAIDSAGGTAVLDIYEGMPHVHQVTIPNSPEAALALKKMAAFLKQYLGSK